MVCVEERTPPLAEGKKLVIVESPTKMKSIQGYLGDGYEVLSSVGHIRDLADKMNSRAIVRAIAELANSLRIGTTAEGIETQEQLDYVKRVGCTEGQGYLFGKPQPAKDARALLASQSSQPRAAAAKTESI